MKLIVGLGNPGFRYRKTRHNAGFLAVDYIQKNINGFSKWKNSKVFAAEISKNEGNNILLAKPQTYMNKSGNAAKNLITNYQLPITNLFIIHDDFDIPIGEFKIEQNRGAAGHKGVQSIIDALRTNGFWRVRIGIRPSFAEATEGKPLSTTENIKAEDFVLKKFTREERKIIEKIIPGAITELFKDFEN